jgi:hypothetical protein
MHHDAHRVQSKRRKIQIEGKNGFDEIQSFQSQRKIGRKKGKIEIGEKYGRLTATKLSTSGRSIFQCECGSSEKSIRSAHVLAGKILSCGCLLKEVTSKNMTKHGLSKTKEFRAWSHMKNRCLNQLDPVYKYYGARGISYCEKWNDFLSFYKDMGPSPSPKHSIDRIDTNGNYEPKNCKWSSPREQANNKRQNKILTHNGRSQTLSMWCSELNLPYHTVKARLNKHGWDVSRSLTTPIRPKKKSV